MIVIAIIGIVATLAISALTGGNSTQVGFNGVTETRCQAGFKVIVGANGYVQQLIGANGGGVPCD